MNRGRHTSTPEQKKRRLLYVVLVIAALFVIRLILLQTGRIGNDQPLDEAELAKMFRQSQYLVQAGEQTAGGTLLQIQEPTGLHKDQKETTYYILTTYEVAAQAGEAEKAEAETDEAAGADSSESTEENGTETGLDGSCTITDSNGVSVTGSFVSADEETGCGVVSYTSTEYMAAKEEKASDADTASSESSVAGFSVAESNNESDNETTETEADSVYFSENTLYQLSEGAPVYYLDLTEIGSEDKTEGSDNSKNSDSLQQLLSTPVQGSFVSRSTAVNGYDGNRMVFTPAAGSSKTDRTGDTWTSGKASGSGRALPGSGVFSAGGYFLGMVSGEDAATGNIVCVAGNTAVDYFRTNH